MARLQILRSPTRLNRPPGSSLDGEPYVNFPDAQFGVMNGGAPVDLLAVRFFSANTSYVAGNYAVQGGQLYRAKVAVPAGAFNPAQWDGIVTPPLPARGHIAGLTLAFVDTGHFSVAVGEATSDDVTTLMTLGATITKSFAAWGVGNAGGLDTGAIASTTWYYVFLIERTDTGVVDVLFSTSPTAPVMPASYTKKRRIGSIKTGAGNALLNFTQFDDEFLWSVVNTDVSGGTGVAPTLYALASVPLGITCVARIRIQTITTGSGAGGVLVTSPFEPANNLGTPLGNYTAWGAYATNTATGTVDVRVNTLAQVRVAAWNAGTSLYLLPYGWIDTRGRFA